MNRLTFFEHGYAQWGMELGLISPSMFARFIHYKMYCELREAGMKKGEAIIKVAEKTCSSESTVWRSVHFFID